ncbi:hypothetical protein [Halomonas denitrificans]|nr:hypothetical protein [Halomonas denitrificans]
MSPGPGSPAPERIVLVRRASSPDLHARLLRLLGDRSLRTRVFLQADGVTLAADPDVPESLLAAADWQVCSGSWKRRHDGDPPAPFEPATLAAWLDVLLPDTGPGPDLVSIGRAERVVDDR